MANFRIHGFMKAIEKGNFTNNPMSRFLVPNSSSCLINYHSKSSECPTLKVTQEFDAMIHTRPLPHVNKFNILLHNHLVTEKRSYSSCSLVLDMFKKMFAVGVLLNTFTAYIQIKCYRQLQHTNLSFTVLGCFFKQGIVFNNTWIYNTILDGFIVEDKTHEAERLFKKMFIMNNDNELDQLLVCLKPDIVTYNTMLKGLCKVGDNITAIALLKLMDRRGGCCKPDIVSYNTVIDGLCTDPGVANMLDDALKLCNEMVFRKGIHRDADTYNSLIYAFSKLGRWDEVCKMVKLMEDECVSLDLKIFNNIVHALCKQGNLKEALGVIIIMRRSGINKYRPDIVTYNSLIYGLCSQGLMSIAMDYFQLLGKKRGVKLDSVTYNTLIDGYIKNFKEDEAIKVFSTMPKQLVNKVTYFLLSGLITMANHHHYRSSKLEYRDDIKCSYLNHLYIHNDSYEKALDLFDFMDGRHEVLNSNIQVYNILIFGANKCGRFDVARKLFHQLNVKGLQPDDVTCTLIIRGFCQVGLFKDAKRMFVEMKRIGTLSDRVVDIDHIPLCYLEENDFNSSACVFAEYHTELVLLKLLQPVLITPLSTKKTSPNNFLSV